MDKLSELLKEARPLYKKRQRRKAIAKLILYTTMPAIILSSACQVCSFGEDIYLSLENNSLQSQLLEDDFEFLGLNTIEKNNN